MTMDLFELNNRIKEMSDEEIEEFYLALRQRQRDKVTGEVKTKRVVQKKVLETLTPDQIRSLLETLK